MKQAFDVGVGTDASSGIIDLDITCTYPLRTFYQGPGCLTYSFPFDLAEAKMTRDMLNDAIEHVEAGGHV